MNKQLFKLIFSQRLGMLVPTSEAAKSHQSAASLQTAMPSVAAHDVFETALFAFTRWQRILWSLAFVVLSDMGGSIAYALDVNALPTGGVIRSGNVNISTSGRTMNIQSLTGKSTIRWNTFDIGRDAQVNFTMPSRSSSVLNRVMGNKASEIYGALNANGHVYLVNQNGIYFGNGAQVNVGSLTATTLDDITNDNIETIYNNGLLSDTTSPIFSFASAVGSIEVDRGASITSANGGRVMLLAPDVTNSGVIKTPDGQTILAAGKTIYLSTTDDFAGLLVEVSSGGTATNLGDIVVNNGNASLVGLAVNQQGRISASTSVRANGSIYLKAKEIQSLTTPGNDVYGAVTLGKNSVTKVTVDVDNQETVIDAQKIADSEIRINGKTIDINSTLVANSGNINVTATDNQGSNAKILVGENAVLDVSGVDASAPMSRNQLAIQLFSDQLRDSPSLRGGALFGETLYLDARKGTDIISQDVIDEAMASISRTVAERMTDGGQVNLNATSVVVKSGAQFDLSAGTTTYEAGNIRESRLLNNGKWVLASDAKSGVAYQGINDAYSKSYARWGQTRSWQLFSSANGRYQAGYTEGGDAGALAITSTSLAFQGDILANTTIGTYQRGDVDGVKTPLGGLLDVTLNAGNLNFVNNVSLLDSGFGINDSLNSAQKANSELDVSLLEKGVNRLKVTTTGQVNVNAEMQFKPNATVTMDANNGLNVNQSILAPSGTVALSASQTADVVLGDGVTISTAGTFTNDTPGIAGAMQGLVALNGGNITISDGLRLGKNATLDASGGAWINASRSLATGEGGDITVTLADGNNVKAGSFSSFGFLTQNGYSQGGHLVVNLQGDGGTGLLDNIQIGGNASASSSTLTLSEQFFTSGGFSSFKVSNNDRVDGDIIIGDNTNQSITILPQQQTRVMTASARGLSSGTDIHQVSETLSVADSFRSPAALTLNAGDDLTLMQNASIVTDAPIALNGARGDVTLHSKGQMTILGDITAPAAKIDIAIEAIPESGDITTPNKSFDHTLSLFIGASANLSATAQYITPPTSDGNLRSAFVADAGSISLEAGNGVLIQKEGSVLDVSGAQGQVDVAVSRGFERQVLSGDAGSISLSARDGLALDGTLLGKAIGSGAAGELHVSLGGKSASGIEGDTNSPLFFTNGTRVLTLTQNKTTLADNNVAGGVVDNLIGTTDPVKPLTNASGKGQISVAQIEEGGFDSVYLKTDNVSNVEGDAIQFATGVNLRVPSLLSLDSTLYRGAASLSASTLVLTNTSGVNESSASINTGAGTFLASANFIDIQGNVAISDVNTTSLMSRSDIRGRGTTASLSGVASLIAPTTILLDAAQIYPSTATDFTVSAIGNNSRIEVTNSANVQSSVPFSAVGSLTLNADTIVQDGTLRAPLGQITLNADQQLTLKEGSLTSVSAEGSLIPYAVTVLGGTEYAESVGATNTFLTKLRDKKITLNGDNVDLQTGSKVDVSGGGDTFAYEWIEGIGGSSDILGQSGYYAVLPSLGNQYAPYDYLMNRGSDQTIGQAIYLAGGNGLSAGKYTLLPARYALVPGAYLVKVNGEAIKQNSTMQQLDGSVLSSGYFTKLDDTSRDQYTSFSVYKGSLFYDDAGTKNYKGPAEYLVTNSNDFFTKKAKLNGTSTPNLASDAGQVVLAANTSLNLAGSLVTEKPTGAKGAIVDISADAIRIVSSVDTSLSNVLQISADQLSSINADSVLLGGTRSVNGNTQTVTTNASSITVANDANHVVALSELMMASKDTLSVNAGAVIQTSPSTAAVGTTVLKTNGDGALLALSSKNDFDYSRTGVSTSPTSGNLVITNGAQLSAGRSMVIDATASSTKSGSVSVGDGGTVTLGANQFVLGDGSGVNGTQLDNTTLNGFGDLSAITFNSYKNINIFGGTTFGQSGLDITFNTAGVAHQGSGNITLVADTFTLKNTVSGTFTAAGANTDTLTVNANTIALGETSSNSVKLDGFNQVQLNANQSILTQGTGTLSLTASNTTLQSAGLTGASGANYAITSTGSLNTSANANTLSDSGGVGASLSMTASELNLGGNIQLSSGALTATATSGHVNVNSGANIDVSARAIAFDENNSATPDAGNITLVSNTGNVQIQSGAMLDLSGGDNEGDAGKLTINAKAGQFIVAANTLNAIASEGNTSGSFVMDVNSLSNFSQVNTALEQGHFNASRDLRVRTGNVNIASSDTVNANTFTLGVDAGNVEIAGIVSADGAKGGDISVYASGLVTLKSTGQLLARGTAVNQSTGDFETGSGGTVLLSSNSIASTNAVSAENGAVIDTSGYDASDNGNVGVDGADGSVTLRGRRGTTGTANTVNVAFATTGAIKGASEVRVEGARSYTSTTFSSSIAGLVTDTNNFYNANTTSGSYAATQEGTTIEVLPYIEVRSTSGSTPTALTVSADQNLRSFGTMLAGRGGTLTLRSNGNLVMNGSLSDGFSTATTAGILQSNTKTFDYNLIAGADYSAANVETTVNGTGNFSLANSKLIRTGEGDITIAAGGNMTLGNTTSVIYTVGKATDTLSGFSATTSGTNSSNAASYVNNGGDINIVVQGDITGVATTQSVNQWLLRQGGNGVDTSWWVRPDLFAQGVGALGGGDVNVVAGGNISNLSASSATNAQYDNFGTSPSNTFVVNGGGDVSVVAGGNITNGVYYAGRGSVALDAGKNILKSGATGTVIALQEASADIKANNDIKLETVFNPTLWVQGNTITTTLLNTSTFFNTYSNDASLNVTSLSGNVEIGLKANNALASTGLSGGYTTAINNDMAAVHPGTVKAVAYEGDLTVYKMVLAPSEEGNLTLLAKGDVTGGATSSGNRNPTAQVLISDADLTSVLNVNNPTVGNPTTNTDIIGSIKTGVSGTPVHQNDPTVAVIVAKEGNVSFTGTPTTSDSTNVFGIKSSKPVYINAGNDVTLHASIQHNQSSDVSLIQAGNDFVMQNGQQFARVEVNGPGNLLVKAARNIDLGNTSGILSQANTQNPNLSESGANLTLLAGLGKEGVDVSGFVSTYINPTGTGPASLNNDPSALAAYRKATMTRVQAFMNEHTGQSLSEADAMTKFLALDKTHQELFVYRQFNAELLEAGKEYINTASTVRSDNAIATLFTGNQYQGDMLMYQSQLKTARDSDITLLAPGGKINAGVASNNSLQHDIGIITEKGGSINAFADDDFLVNQSKVITQFGSDILIWSDHGDVDAGRGSKSAISVPERVVSIDTNGEVTVEVKGVAAGSGIRAQTYDPDGPSGAQQAPGLGTVALFAPRGVLNAGEAGIAAGNLLVGATLVLNSSNITVAGTSTGVPVADAGSLAGSLAGVADTATASTNSMASNLAQPAPQTFSAKDLPSIVTVKTISIGD